MSFNVPTKQAKTERAAPCTREEAAALFLMSREYEGAQSAYFSPLAVQKEWLLPILFARDVYSDPKTSVEKVCAAGNVRFLHELLVDGYPITTRAFWSSLYCERRDCLEVLLTWASPSDEVICREAARLGKVAFLSLLLMCGAPRDERSCFNASYNGNLECLRLLIEHGAVPDKRSTEYAAQYGHLECLRYLVGCKTRIEPRAIAMAASNGHIECVRFLLDINAPIDECSCIYAFGHNRVDVLRLLLDNEAPTGSQLCRIAVSKDNEECTALVVERKISDYGDYIGILDKIPATSDEIYRVHIRYEPRIYKERSVGFGYEWDYLPIESKCVCESHYAVHAFANFMDYKDHAATANIILMGTRLAQICFVSLESANSVIEQYQWPQIENDREH